MARGHNNPESIIASCADYDSEADAELVDSKKLANVAAKRSSQQMTPAPAVTDVASDSGYSSRTQATAASADSIASVNLKSAKAAAKASSLAVVDNEVPATPGPSSRRRATENGASDTQQAPDNSNAAPQRETSTKQKRKVIVQCKDLDCDKCVAARGRKPVRKVKISTHPSPEKSPAKAQSDTRPSRPSARPSAYPVQPQGARRSSSSGGARPRSMYDVSTKMMTGQGPPPAMYNRGVYPGQGYPHPGTLAIVERPGALTRTISARQTRPVSIHPPNGLVHYNPNAGTLLSARRPMKTALDQSDTEEEVDKRELQRSRQMAQRQQPVQPVEEPESEEEDSEEVDEDDEDDDDDDYEDEATRAAIAIGERNRRLAIQQRQNGPAELQQRIAAAEARQRMEHLKQLEQLRRLEQQNSMPPPAVPASALQNGQKLSMRKMNAPAPQITYGTRPSMDGDEDILRSAWRDHQSTSSTRRPSLASSGGTKATSYSQPTGNARVTVEGHRNRRLSYIGSEDQARLAAMHAPFARPQPDLQTIIVDVVRQQLDKLQLTPSQSMRSRVDIDDRLQEALKYQHRTDANATRPRDTLGELRQMPLTEAALRRRAANPSHVGSTRSNRSSDEGRISHGHRLTAGSESGAVTVNGDEMTVRIDTTNGFEMEFEGRKITILPTNDSNMAELIIGGQRETSYSTRGSTVTRSQFGSKIGRTPSTRDTRDRDRELRDRDRELRERDERRDRKNRRQKDRPRYEEEDDSASEDEPPSSRRSDRRRRTEIHDSEYSRAGSMRRQPRQSPRESRDDRHDDYPPQGQRGSRPQPPYAPGPSYGGYNGRGPNGPPSNVFGA